MLLQRSADGNTVDGGLSGVAQEGLVGDSSLGKLLLSVAIDGCLYVTALDGGHMTLPPRVFGRGPSVSPGATETVSDIAGPLEALMGPAAGMSSQGGLVLGSILLASVGRFAGAVVLRRRGGITKV